MAMAIYGYGYPLCYYGNGYYGNGYPLRCYGNGYPLCYYSYSLKSHRHRQQP